MAIKLDDALKPAFYEAIAEDKDLMVLAIKRTTDSPMFQGRIMSFDPTGWLSSRGHGAYSRLLEARASARAETQKKRDKRNAVDHAQIASDRAEKKAWS